VLKIQIFMRHDLDPELVDLLEKIDTYGNMEICGPMVILEEYDPDAIPADIRKIAREIERIQSVYERVGWPWVAREVLEGNAVIIDGKLHYRRRRENILRKEVEEKAGRLTDKQFKLALDAATQEVIKIAAQCAIALKRCGV